MSSVRCVATGCSCPQVGAVAHGVARANLTPVDVQLGDVRTGTLEATEGALCRNTTRQRQANTGCS